MKGAPSALALAILGLLVLGAALASLAFGDAALPARDLGAALLGQGDELARTVLWDIRLPRTLVGLAVGAALGASGVQLGACSSSPARRTTRPTVRARQRSARRELPGVQ